MESKNTIVKDAITLFALTLIAGLLLGFVYELTKEPIKAQEAKAKSAAFEAVFAEATFEEDADITAKVGEAAPILEKAGLAKESIIECLPAKDSSGNVAGYVLTVSTNEGYGGEIKLSMGVKSDGTVNGIQFLTLAETAGLGMKAQDAAFKDQYANKKVDQFQYTKSGSPAENEIQAISGATITTNAVTNAVNAGLCFLTENGLITK